MSLQLKKIYQRRLPLANLFLNSLSKSNKPETLHKKILDSIQDLKDFDSKMGFITFQMLEFSNSNYEIKKQEYIALQKAIYKERQALLKHFKVKEINHSILKPQKPVSSITQEAFLKNGINKLSLKESLNDYALLYK